MHPTAGAVSPLAPPSTATAHSAEPAVGLHLDLPCPLWHYGIVQLNIHVPRDREQVIVELEAEAIASGRAKNQIVLDALAAYLRPRGKRGRRKPRLRTWNLGAVGELRRVDLYEERVDAKLGPGAG
jgi:hypothetical protein